MPLTPEFRADIERRLRERRAELMAAVQPRISGDAPDIAPATHMAENEDRPTAEMISHNEEQFADHETAALHAIDVALGSLAAGGYGICVECGCEIPEARLLATPTVQTCVRCQERLEKEQRRGAGPAI
jgi:RNA polymerase-binding transcription factor DksA